jgi:type IV pilus assembly protein PilW
MIRHSNDRGFTLTELLVALVVTGIVIAGALGLLVAQRRAFKDSAADRAQQESARAAISEMGMNLRRAGYGVDPWFAFDFGPLTGSATTNHSYEGGVPGGTRVSCEGAPVTCRDSTSGSDEIVFYARDPAFSRRLAAAPTTTTLRFTAALSSALLPGQIVQLMCSGGGDRAYVTVASTSSDLLSVTLDTSRSGTFPFQQDRISSGCFTRSFAAAGVFLIERFHYFVSTYADPAHPAGRPYLMLDRGLTLDGAPLVEPVAPDIEDLQFAYVFQNGTVVGNTASTSLANSPASIDLAAAPPAYDASSEDAARTSNSPANIRAVRASVVVRTPNYTPEFTNASDLTIPATANRAANASGSPGYRRVVVETTAATRNLNSRAPFMPPYSTNNGADGLNVGGG